MPYYKKITAKKSMGKVFWVYEKLFQAYGPQGWWPMMDCAGTNPTKAGVIKGYHVGDYTFPKNQNQKFEICIGAILTQNTSWVQVEKSLLRLNETESLTPEKIRKMNEEKLKEAIHSSGYYNQKAQCIRNFVPFFESLGGRTPSREELLSLRGVGPETADSILLYAFSQPEFVVDAYTKRIFLNLGLIKSESKYIEIKNLFEKELLEVVADKKELVEVYQEYHALLVEHAKRYYNKKPYGGGCFLL